MMSILLLHWLTSMERADTILIPNFNKLECVLKFAIFHDTKLLLNFSIQIFNVVRFSLKSKTQNDYFCASQQTNFGRVGDLPGLPAPEDKFIENLEVCASISSNRDRGSFDSEELGPSKRYRSMWKKKSCFVWEATFLGRRVWMQVKVIQIPMTKVDLFLNIWLRSIPKAGSLPSHMKRDLNFLNQI